MRLEVGAVGWARALRFRDINYFSLIALIVIIAIVISNNSNSNKSFQVSGLKALRF